MKTAGPAAGAADLDKPRTESKRSRSCYPLVLYAIMQTESAGHPRLSVTTPILKPPSGVSTSPYTPIYFLLFLFIAVSFFAPRYNFQFFIFASIVKATINISAICPDFLLLFFAPLIYSIFPAPPSGFILVFFSRCVFPPAVVSWFHTPFHTLAFVRKFCVPLYAVLCRYYALFWSKIPPDNHIRRVILLLLRPPKVHHGAGFSLFYKGFRSLSFWDYILSSIL